jgi:glutathione S-transferase
MSGLHLIIGNKNYSSWSLRPWLAMTAAGIPFRETVIPLDTPETAKLIAEHSPSGRVPVLRDGGLTVWESLAIIEYVAERFPDAAIWPEERQSRAVARSVSHQMHAGFSALRNACPMNLRRKPKAIPLKQDVLADVTAIETLWRDCRKSFGGAGPYLFGAFSAADAMYAPVVTRFRTYEISVAADTKAYMDQIYAHPAFRAWFDAGVRESWIVPSDEVD